eukprot:jgi/Psemu1/16691/gm1.16691_g
MTHVGTSSTRKSVARKSAASSLVALGMIVALSSTIPRALGYSSPHKHLLQNSGRRNDDIVGVHQTPGGMSAVDKNCVENDDVFEAMPRRHSTSTGSTRRGFVASAAAAAFLPLAETVTTITINTP